MSFKIGMGGVMSINIDLIRRQYPALASGFAYLENAGGSQMPRIVADSMRHYMLHTFVQLGAGYEVSRKATATVDEAHAFMNLFVNGQQTGEVAFGSSTSTLCRMLADCYAEILQPGDEVIVSEIGHEANVGPWVRLEKHGIKIKWWRLDPESMTTPLGGLEPLLTEKTKIVAFPHVSNLLGEILDVKAITALAHRVGARVIVDGVAYAPHRAIDVQDWDVDWYAFSAYKVYGPHMGVLYGKRKAFLELTGPNHFFISHDEIPYKFELGSANYESCAGVVGLSHYFKLLAGQDAEVSPDRTTITKAYEVMAACEAPLQERMISDLLTKPQVRIMGPSHWQSSRVGTVSFVHQSLSSASIVRIVDEHNIGIRNGNMYAYRLCEALGLEPEDGVVRVSFVHYNTLEEIERLIRVLDSVL
jgi:cysteine desulfurase family protein (TIGR01976 family)